MGRVSTVDVMVALIGGMVACIPVQHVLPVAGSEDGETTSSKWLDIIRYAD